MKITLSWARRTLKAVEKTIGQYKAGTYGCLDCSLCHAAGRFKQGDRDFCDDDKCVNCPWIIFKKSTCLGLQYGKDPIPLRLRRLYGWRVRLLNIIRKFKEAA